MEIFICFGMKTGEMSKTFHKNQGEQTFVFQDCFFAYKRKMPPDPRKKSQVLHKLFSLCGKLRKVFPSDVENCSFFVETEKKRTLFWKIVPVSA